MTQRRQTLAEIMAELADDIDTCMEKKECRYEKVIFLDFDGVLNCQTTADRMPVGMFEYRGIDREKVELVNEIIRQTGAVVVISSSWRFGRTLVELRELLGKYGFEGKIVDKTPMKLSYVPRATEIFFWLDDNGIPKSFLVLDDMPTDFDRNHIQTSDEHGLQHHHVAEAIAILNG